MKVAVPVWNGNVSPVLDTAEQLVVFEIEKGKIISRSELPLGEIKLSEKAKIIASSACVLICGAMSSHLASLLSSFGLDVYPWVMGDVESLVEMFASGEIPGAEFSMPGCRGKQCGRRMGRRGHGPPRDRNF